MKAGVGRLLVLLFVFGTAFGGVVLWRKWRDDRGLVGFVREREQALIERQRTEFRPERYTLEDLPALDLEEVPVLARLNQEYTKLVGGVVPSVVSIDTVGELRERFNYYGRIYERHLERSIGSGVIVTPEGHVVTNEHVIDGTIGVKVTLHDGQSYSARLIGKDTALDIAVLRIEGEGPFPTLNFGDSDEVNPGEMVFAVGNPFGFGESVTQGIVSAKERSISDQQRDLFQTDAAINPGSSGGPLVNFRGEIIGINVAIYSPDTQNRGFAGVGFSIPSNDVEETFKQILQRGRPVRGFLGLNGRQLNQLARYELGYPRGNGVAIEAVVPGSPAEAAGLRVNDIILKYGGERVESLTQLITIIQRTRVGEEIELEIWRRREIVNLVAQIMDFDEWQQKLEEREKAEPLADDREIMRQVGLAVRDLSVLERMRGKQGAMVVSVLEGSLAEEAGVQTEDLVLEVNGRRVVEARDMFARIAASAAVQDTVLSIRRGSILLEKVLPKVARN
ncbi:MAG: trypsin-like peptidase domain-containing protein [Verrucomicrobiota bacterium]